MKKLFKKIIIYSLIICSLLSNKVYALTKEENVYTKLDESGNVESISIYEHLFDYKNKTIKDKSILNNIENVNGNDKYNKNENDIIWEANGNDIYYKGEYNKKLPISIKVKYYFNGKEVKVNDILGKKGNIKIVMSFDNNLYEKLYINGNKEKMYVPYAIMTTLMLDNSNNTNIKVTNGKVINNGSSSIISAISSPGLYESLKISSLKDIDTVEVSYDTDSFELSTIYFVATNSIFDNDDLDIFKEMNNLYKSVDILQDNMNKIVESSKKLNTGSTQMNDGISKLNSKIQELTDKYRYYRGQDQNVLKEQLIKLVEKNINMITPALEEDITNEASKIIKENKDELESSLITYTKKNTESVIDEEVSKIINKMNINSLMQKVINSNLYNVLKNDSTLNEITNSLKKEINSELKEIISKELKNINKNIDSNLNQREEYIKSISEKYGVTYEQAEGIVGEVQTDTINQIKNSINIDEMINNIMTSLNNKDYLSNIVNEYTKKLNKIISESLNKDTTIEEYGKELKEKILNAIYSDLKNESKYLDIDIKKHISSLVDKVIDDTAKDLASKYTEEYTNEVVENVIKKQFSEKNIDSKLKELLDKYDDDINEKVTMLDDTINTLSDSLNKLNEGSKQLSNGMDALSQGLDQYNKKGINKINKLVNSDVKTYQKRFETLSKLSHNNKTIDLTSSNAKSNSKMIFMIDSIENNKIDNHNEIEKENKTSFIDKVKGLFK